MRRRLNRPTQWRIIAPPFSLGEGGDVEDLRRDRRTTRRHRLGACRLHAADDTGDPKRVEDTIQASEAAFATFTDIPLPGAWKWTWKEH